MPGPGDSRWPRASTPSANPSPIIRFIMSAGEMDGGGDKGAYVLDNADEQTSARFAALPRLYDPGTIRHLEQLGVGPGWRCLEVGGGGGSIAAWLSDRVGPTGHVLATDLDPRFL